MRKVYFLPLLLICSAGFAQQDIASKYAALITPADLKKLLTVIASAGFEGRETGTVGQQKAAAYIEGRFTALNLERPSIQTTYEQFYPLYRDSVLQASLTVDGTAAANGIDFLIPLSTNENVRFTSSNLVFAGYGIDDPAYSDYTSINVKGKIVVFFLGEPKKDGKFFIDSAGKMSSWTSPGLSKKLLTAADKGAVGALVVNQSAANFPQRLLERNMQSNLFYPPASDGRRRLNYALLSHSFAKKIFPVNFDNALSAAKTNSSFTPQPTDGKTKIEYIFRTARTTINASNVIGYIEGTDKKDEYVFLTGHYDHLGIHDGKIWYGADDDGSGTCGVIEMANAFMQAVKDGHRPRRTIVFMTVSGEEEGLWGSQYYTDHPIFPLDKTSVDLNTDMVGRIDTERKSADTTNYIYVIGHDKLSSDLPVINEGENNNHTHLVLDYKFDDPDDPNRIYYRSDHYNFARKGVPILFFYDGMLKADYHQPTDTVDKIDFDQYAKRVQMIFYTAWDIANRDEMLKRDKPLPAGGR